MGRGWDVSVAVAAVALAGTADARTEGPLGWLAGCWIHDEGRTEERWIDAGSGLFFGHSVTRRAGVPVAFEDLRIEPRGPGFVYVASPDGRAPVAFPSVAVAEDQVVFEKPDHDFPQRIGYRRDGARLIARISALDGSRATEFVMTRCPGSGGE